MSRATINLDELMQNLTLTARLYGVRLNGRRRFYWRVRVAMWLFHLGAWVANMGFEGTMSAAPVDEDVD